MKWLTDIDDCLAKRESEQRRLLLIFKGNGDWCPWCNKLEKLLSDSPDLDEYLETEDILGAKIGIPRKDEDTEGVREKFGITGIPFLLFYAEDGRLEGTSEYIDGGSAQTYVQWIESVDSSGL